MVACEIGHNDRGRGLQVIKFRCLLAVKVKLTG